MFIQTLSIQPAPARGPRPPEITRILQGEEYTASIQQEGEQAQGFYRRKAQTAGFVIKLGEASVFVTDTDLARAVEARED